MKKYGKWILVVVVLLFVGAFFYFDLGQHLTLENLKTQKDELLSLYDKSPLLTLGIYFAVYVAVTAMSLPGATILTLAGGALFGLVLGTVVVSFASTIGATLAFLISRFLLRDWVESRFGDRLKSIHEGIKKEGAFYLLTLRLIPVVPFFVINLVMGLTPFSWVKFFYVSQVGMLLGTMVYVNAGTQLSQINSLGDIFNPALWVSFTLLGILPLISKKVVDAIKAKRVYRPYPRPKSYDYNMVVIGGGAAGLVSSYIAAAVKAKVCLIERDKMGGDCLNTGCVPSKAIIQTAKVLAHAKRAKEFGIAKLDAEFRFSDVMERVQRVIKKIEPHDSVERYQGLGVECLKGDAKILSPFQVQVGERILTTRSIILATGAEPFVPPFKGLDQVPYHTSETIWGLKELPKRLVILGGGPIGCELAQTFQRLGSQVIQVEMAPSLLIREDADVAHMIQKRLEVEGVEVRTEHTAKEFFMDGAQKVLLCDFKGEEVRIEFDEVLMALGRKARVKGFGLEELQVELTERRTIKADPYLATNFPNIYVCGDATGPYQFTHVAAHQAWFASVNSLFAPLKRFKVDYRVIPWVTYTDPEVAHVGLSERDAKAKGIDFEVTRWDIKELDRAITDEEDHGMVKVITKRGQDKILGATIASAHAGEMIAEFVLAMKGNMGLSKILGTVHAYPTWVETNKYAAGEWKKNHKPEGILNFLEKFHRFRRG